MTTTPLAVRIDGDQLRIGRHVAVRFERTLRIPDDGREYPLPPGLGTFPILRVDDYADRVPPSWRGHGGVFIPMYQREALWLDFTASSRHQPHALKVGVGKVNAVSGKPWDDALHRRPQDYVVVPEQPWLDGINAGNGFIRQFVAMPLGMGYTVEGQLTGEEKFGGIQIMVVGPRPGRFPKEPRPRTFDMMMACAVPGEMGLGAGGRMRQRIHPDPHEPGTWNPARAGRVFVHIVNSMAFREITGMEPPPTPVSAEAYTDAGLPWFDLYDEHLGDLDPSDELADVKSVKEKDADHGFTAQQDDAAVDVPAGQLVELSSTEEVRDGLW